MGARDSIFFFGQVPECARRPTDIPKGPKKKKKKKIKIDGHIKTPTFSMLYCSFGYFLLGIKYK